MKSVWFLLLILFSEASSASPFYFGYQHANTGSRLSYSTGGQEYGLLAGSGFELDFGTLFVVSPTTPHGFELQLTTGIIYSDGRDNDHLVQWIRFPLEAIYYYHNFRDDFRIGWGPVFHFNNQLYGVTNNQVNGNLNNSWGWTFTVEKCTDPSDHQPNKSCGGLKYKNIKYNSQNFNKEADGSGIALTFGVFL